MERNEIVEKLTEIFRKVFTDDTLVLADGMTSNNVEKWDSLTHMLMITEVEGTFGIKFRLKDLNKMKNVGNLIEIIQVKLA